MRKFWRLMVPAIVAAIGGCGESDTPQAAPPDASAQAVEVIPATAAEILKAVRSADASAVLVNAWATFCVPCREEFPDMMRLYNAYKGRGLKLILVSGDFEDQMPQVRQFLSQQGVDFPSYIKNEKDMAFINGLDARWSGALPASWVFDAGGNARHFWEGKASYREFEQKVLDVLTQ